MRLKKLPGKVGQHQRTVGALGFATAFAIVGVLLLLAARAATPTASLQPEEGSRTANATIVTDPLASNSQAVLFKAPSTGGDPTGVWKEITMPSGFTNCDFAVVSVGVDPNRLSNLYTKSDCSDVLKSTDYGKTWARVSTPGSADGDCGGGLSVGKSVTAGGPPALYIGCFRSPHGNFARSTDGGVSWSWVWFEEPTWNGGRDAGFYAPVIDPYDSNHLLMAGHEASFLFESANGGVSWQKINLNSGMNGGGTAFPFFVNTGSAATTADTWLWIPQDTDPPIGTWRTANGGSSWQRVETLEHPHGNSQFFQPDTSGLIFMAGFGGSQGDGIYRSTNYGQNWSRVGTQTQESNVYGTPNRVYASHSGACAHCGSFLLPNYQSAPMPGATGWTATPLRPAGDDLGPAQVATTFDGSHYILVSANWADGMWRYIEP